MGVEEPVARRRADSVCDILDQVVEHEAAGVGDGLKEGSEVPAGRGRGVTLGLGEAQAQAQDAQRRVGDLGEGVLAEPRELRRREIGAERRDHGEDQGLDVAAHAAEQVREHRGGEGASDEGAEVVEVLGKRRSPRHSGPVPVVQLVPVTSVDRLK